MINREALRMFFALGILAAMVTIVVGGAIVLSQPWNDTFLWLGIFYPVLVFSQVGLALTEEASVSERISKACSVIVIGTLPPVLVLGLGVAYGVPSWIAQLAFGIWAILSIILTVVITRIDREKPINGNKTAEI